MGWIPAPRFFLFSFFPHLFLIPYERINWRGWGAVFRPLCLDPFFLPSSQSLVFSSSSPFLALVLADTVVAGVDSRIIKKYIFLCIGLRGNWVQGVRARVILLLYLECGCVLDCPPKL